MRAKLLEQHSIVMDLLPDLKAGTHHNIRGPNSICSISFADAALASRAYEIFRTKEVEWEDRVSGFTRTLKFYRDQKYEDRTASRIVSRMWEPTKETIQGNGRWKDDMRLLNTGRRLWVVDQDEPFPLFTVTFTSKDAYNITVDEKNPTYYGIDQAAVAKIRAAGMPAQGSA
jgi:hypothetical protein